MDEEKEALTFDELCDIVRPIAEEYGMMRVYLFGSRARGNSRPDSDYDFYVVPIKRCGVFKLAGFYGKLKDAIGSEIDVVCEDPYEVDDFVSNISKDMKLVYGSRSRSSVQNCWFVCHPLHL